MSLKLSEREQRMKKRGVILDKEMMAEFVKKTALRSKSLDDLETQLKEQGIDCYRRKNILTGCWLGKRKYRLTTLGVGKEHLKILTREQERLQELERDKKRQQNRNRGRER